MSQYRQTYSPRDTVQPPDPTLGRMVETGTAAMETVGLETAETAEEGEVLAAARHM